MTVRVRYVLGTDLASRAIARFSGGHLSHAEAMRDDGQVWGARDDRVGGKPPGVQLRPNDYASFAYQIIYTIPTTELEEQSFWAWWESQEGKPYDSRAILGFAFDKSWHDSGAWICSAAVTNALQSIDLIAWDLYLPPNKITPVVSATLVSGIKYTTYKEIS